MAKYQVIGTALKFEGRTYNRNQVIETERDLLAEHPHRVWLLDDDGNRVRDVPKKGGRSHPHKAQESPSDDDTGRKKAHK